ncbi:hypothetical protein BST61_g10588 [Cercospora zeina]
MYRRGSKMLFHPRGSRSSTVVAIVAMFDTCAKLRQSMDCIAIALTSTSTSSFIAAIHDRIVSMDMLDAAVTWTSKNEGTEDPVQVAGLGILPAVSHQSQKHSTIAMSDCCHFSDCCEVQYSDQATTKSRKEGTTLVIKSGTRACSDNKTNGQTGPDWHGSKAQEGLPNAYRIRYQRRIDPNCHQRVSGLERDSPSLWIETWTKWVKEQRQMRASFAVAPVTADHMPVSP